MSFSTREAAKMLGLEPRTLSRYLTFQGPKNRKVAIEPGSSQDVLLSPGQYTITIASSPGGTPLKTQNENLRPGSRLTLEFGITQRINDPLSQERLNVNPPSVYPRFLEFLNYCGRVEP